MNIEQIIEKLKKAAKPSTKRIFCNHGAQEPIFGVPVGDLKIILSSYVKTLSDKKDKLSKKQKLALELYDTGISDAMYLAGFMAYGSLMTEKEINNWIEKAPWFMISEYVVAKIAAQNEKGMKIALQWIESEKELIAAAGWATIYNILSFYPNDKIDQKIIKKLLEKVVSDIQMCAPRVKYSMNAFIVSVGSYIPELTEIAIEAAKKIGKVTVDMPKTSCKVPDAKMYIEKVKKAGKIGKKKKQIGC